MEMLSMMKLLPELLVDAQYDIAGQLMLIWGQIRVSLVYMAIVVAFNKVFGKTTEKRYKWEPFEDNVELGALFTLLFLFKFQRLMKKRFLSCQLELHVGFHGRLIAL
ncbi:putative glucomannan 4-beta-mannosyltransferase [Helianthus annuus]|uniref:Glucomannan 4-beta-mannosyltransferase n=1 Tax=Helianthus annuus TaxID=4232 RepID=A0A251S1P5_HELAN|nr:putative glucomannan 4-beta-mannosyltransferase [Helianthus annuus]KAJ0428900.1 putative glucomannan 4-beta-mannosyltransferase [Helianthus annuus]KAJ0433107.1 putative glucomannan 4-beta-mannosyltransferase [Helianthus annuus]KAJ0447241.1 putative glucomannan 4-beta-mannosyltransferase [Helianthus annuus]KAJ0632153.1 putative glucomannan 4-beta-mannosyltransferase [Helianthus annuus]